MTDSTRAHIQQTRELVVQYYRSLPDDPSKALFRDYLLVFDQFDSYANRAERLAAENKELTWKLSSANSTISLINRLLDSVSGRGNA